MKLIHSLILAAGLLSASLAQALTVEPYSAAALAKAQAAGAPVVLHFHASWCPTCKAQNKALEQLKAEPNLGVTVLQADYDTEDALKKELKVRSQSTMIAYHGKVERAREIGRTAPDDVRALLRAAL